MRLVPGLVAALAALALVVTAAAAPADTMAPVIRLKQKQFGAVLATPKHLALYSWNRERDFKGRCTGACAKAWPPLLLAKGERVPMHVAGIMGDLGSVVRPDGGRQLTLDRRPLYTYSGDGPGQVKCNGVDGWFVVRVH
jgi:predicted lipoprotein with Yx(FWY)xxD motif